MRKLYKATVIMGTATFAAMVAGLVRAKFLAVALGPSGVGIYSQAMTFFQSADTICGLGMSLGITKYVAEAFSKKDYDGIKNVALASVYLQSASFVALFIFTALFSRQISQFVFSSAEYSRLLLVVTAGAVFSAFLVSAECVMLGMRRPDVFSRVKILYNITGVAVLILLVWTMRLTGSFLYIMINSVVSFLLAAIFLSSLLKSQASAGVFETRDSGDGRQIRRCVSRLFSYGTVMLVTSTITWLSILYVRSLLIRREGAAANGLYQVAFAVVGCYTPFFTNSVWGYLFPRLSAAEKASNFNFEMNRAIRFIILFVTPAIAVLFLCGKPLVLLIFSKEFLASLEIFPLYLLGSLFYMISYIFSSGFLARKQLKPYLVIVVVQSVLYIAVFTTFVSGLGLLAVALSYCAMNVFACLASASYQIYRSRLSISGTNANLFISSLIFTAVIFFFPPGWAQVYLMKWVMVAAWLVFVVGKKEKAILFSFLRRGQ